MVPQVLEAQHHSHQALVGDKCQLLPSMHQVGIPVPCLVFLLLRLPPVDVPIGGFHPSRSDRLPFDRRRC